MNIRFSAPLLLALVSQVIACSSSTTDKSTGGKVSGSGDDAGSADSADPCGIHSGFLGDNFCIPPPSQEEGIQIHVGPKDYTDAAEVAQWTLAPGLENVVCYNAKIPDSDFYYLQQKNRMRPSSHHMLLTVQNDPTLQEGPSSACDTASAIASIPGSQTPIHDFPGQLGPEDQGMARYLPPSNMAAVQMHYINQTSIPVLREAWLNLYKEDESLVKQRIQGIFMVGDLTVDIPPQTRQTTTLTFTPTLPGEVRLFDVNAHMHAHAQSFTLWRTHAGVEEQIYQSFSWEDPLDLTFNSVIQNSVADPVSKTDGGLSGIQYLEQGDSLRWACDVNNTTDKDLHFANEALTAEMCMLVGSYVAPTPGLMSGFCAGGACRATAIVKN